MENIGKRIREIRVQKGMTQDQLAAALGTTKAAISRYERGTRRPSYEQLAEISKALGVNYLVLLEDYVEVRSELGETNVYLRDLDGQAEAMPLLRWMRKKADYLLTHESSRLKRAFVNLIQEGSDGMVEPLLDAFQKLDFSGRQLAVDLVEKLANNPCFLRKDPQDSDPK